MRLVASIMDITLTKECEGELKQTEMIGTIIVLTVTLSAVLN
jgi:hypothetical protein